MCLYVVKFILNIKGLKLLNCEGCTMLTSIPNIKGLDDLNCSECTMLTSIPKLKTERIML